MAKNMTWTVKLDSSRLQVKHSENGREQAFYLNKIFPTWEQMTEVQKRIVTNGVKQRLADKLAKSKDEKLTVAERVASVQATWDLLLSGQYTATERATRGPSVTLSKLEEGVLPLFQEEGWAAEKISKFLHISLERVQEILASVVKEETEEEETEE
jgi:hypothetical protein